MTIDLNLLPLVRRAGQDQSSLPGLYASTAPRRSARGRAPDRLILFLALSGNAPLSLEQQTQLLGRFAQAYYETPGSVTAAMRMVIDGLNQNLLERNLRGSGAARQGLGLLTVVVEREGRLYLSHSGPMQAFLIAASGVQLFYDPEGAGRGLGLSQNAPARYFQAELQPRDYLLLTPQPPEAWSIPALQGTHGQGFESLRRRLLSQAGAELNAVMVQALEGSGKMRLLWPKLPAVTPTDKPAPAPEAIPPEPALPTAEAPTTAQGNAAPQGSPAAASEETIAAPETPTPAEQPTPVSAASMPIELPPPAEETMPEPEAIAEAASPLPGPEIPADGPIDMPARPPLQHQPIPDGVPAASASPLPAASLQPIAAEQSGRSSAFQSPETPARPTARRLDQQSPALPRRRRPRQRFSLAPLMARLAPVGRAIGGTLLRVGRSLRALFKSMLPDETLLRIPPATMLVIAVGVAVVLSTAGAVIYLNRGRAAQHQLYYDQALQLAGQAQSQTDPVQQHAAWELTLTELDKAEYYGETEASTLLRGLAQNALDQLDGVRRIDFQPAIINGLAKTIPVTRLAASARDLYLLDGAQGNVIRAILTNIGYGVDANFRCGPGALGDQVVGALVDIVALPEGSQFKATVMGLDQSAHLIYCIPRDNPKAASLATPLDTGWGRPAAIALDSGNLFVLDTEKKKVWVYQGLEIAQAPYSFFDEAVDSVPNLQDVVDIAVNRNELYLLHSDGRLTLCTLGRIDEERTRCTDPVIFADSRPGRQNSEKIADAQFTQLYYAPPPDPSIYLLDADHQSIYHFGLQLTFYGQYRSQSQVPEGAATAFTISPDRVAFIAVGHQVYYSKLP